jgi:transposase
MYNFFQRINIKKGEIMRPARPIEKEKAQSLGRLLKKTKNKADFQRVQCLWLRAKFNMNSSQVATAIGFSSGRVRQIQAQYFAEGEPALIGTGRGGRRNENLSLENEKQLLARFIEKAKLGKVLIASEVKAAYEQAVGKRVYKSTIYRMLARHGWRKITPRPYHSKVDFEEQEEFKKTFLN